MSGMPCESCEDGENLPESLKVTGTTPAVLAPQLIILRPSIIIEFCDRCRWLHRATWTQTELMLTFPPPTLASVTLVPLNSPETGGRFRVWLLLENDNTVLLWDRKSEGFPELKDLKQRVRDQVDPGRSLGHSDKHVKK